MDCLYDTGMTFILEWVLFHDKIEQLIPKCFCLCGFRTRSDTQVPLIWNYMICDLLSGTKKEISYQNVSSFGMKTGMNSF